MGDVEGFESTDAGASETIPMEAGQIRKGGYICIKGRPCKARAGAKGGGAVGLAGGPRRLA